MNKYYERNPNTQSFALANPGALWLGKKWNLESETYKMTSLTVNADRDVVSKFCNLTTFFDRNFIELDFQAAWFLQCNAIYHFMEIATCKTLRSAKWVIF